jgi:type IV pilus assembly protein PilA
MIESFNKTRNKKGFTLIELIVVLAVLGIISLIAVPRYLGMQEKSREEADYRTAASIAQAAELYYARNNMMSTTISYISLETTKLIDEDIKLQSKKYKNLILSDTNVEIKVKPGTGNVFEIHIIGNKLYPDD